MNSNSAYQDEHYQDAPREELINGQIVRMSPRPTSKHNKVCSNIYVIFDLYLKEKTCVPYADGEELFLSEKDRFIPDGMVVCDSEKDQGDGIHGSPDLAIEVLSPSTVRRDRGHKFRAYEKAGVREYWIVDPRIRTVEVYLLQDGRFQLHDVYSHYTKDELADMDEKELSEVVTEFPCGIFPDLTVKLDEVFRRVF